MVTNNAADNATGAANTVLQGQGVGTTSAFSTATYPASTTISQFLYSSSANVVAGLATANSATIVTSSTGVPAMTASLTNGQIVIGSSAATPTPGTITAGLGVTVTNGAASITIATSGGGLTWTDVTGATQTVVANNGYLADRGGGVAFTLPASSTIGDVFRIVGVQGSWSLAQAANQQVKFGNVSTTVGAGGSLASTDAGDSIELVATNTSASSVWRVMSSIGNITKV